MQLLRKSLIGALAVMITSLAAAQTNNPQAFRPRSFLDTPALTNSTYAQALVSSLLQTPVGNPVIPTINPNVARMNLGAYWSLQKSNQPPWPGRFFPELPAYELTPGHFVVDDRAVDYPTLHALQELEAEANGGGMMVMAAAAYDYGDTTNLWLEIPEGGVISNEVNVILHNTIEGLPYTLLTKTDLDLPTWTAEQVIAGAVGNATATLLAQNDRTNLFIWARSGSASTITIWTQPMSQAVLEDDMVTFRVVATGSGVLTYQWTHAGTNLPGATTASLTMDNVWSVNRGEYTVLITDANGSVSSEVATLTVHWNDGDPYHLFLGGNRQDYTFRPGYTYEVNSTVNFYGTTTLKGGTVIRMDWYYTNATLRVLGDLVCDTQPYCPVVITTVDDDSMGVFLNYGDAPRSYPGTPPYLDLTQATSASLHNVRMAYAYEGVTMPANGNLEIWDCQFLKCDRSIVNRGSGTSSLRNTLFSSCNYGVYASTNPFAIMAEHVTSDATNFWAGATTPSRLAVTNCLFAGGFASASSLVSQNTVFNAAATNFAATDAGRYYLSPASPYHGAGTTNVTPALLTALKTKTTSAPIAIPGFTTLSGGMTLTPQIPRATNAVPDLGYHYDVLDYTVANLVLAGGRLSVLPGTAVGLRAEYLTNASDWNWMGFDLRNNSALISHGLPDRPVIFADAQLVQEQTSHYCAALVGLDFWPWDEVSAAPTLDMRFVRSYASAGRSHVWGGYDSSISVPLTTCSLVNWTLQDSALYGGEINLGLPASEGVPYCGAGAVVWQNNLFDQVNLHLNPSSYWFNGNIQCDMTFTARNNLFKRAQWFNLYPFPTTAGNWTLTDNHFETVQLRQFLNAPLDFDHNAYWPQMPASQVWFNFANRLLPSTDTNAISGGHEVVASGLPPYQAGPYGKYYLPQLTPLYHAGSRTAPDTGVYHYTTRVDQFTAGQDFAAFSANGNIGLHYVATTNASSTLPKDTDGDGVPDYMEDANGNGAVDDGETSPVLAQTVSGINDATNSVYDDVDLSGNGLVGRIKKALGLDPLDKNNPLTLKEVAFDEEWGIATYELPVSFNLLTNIGGVNLQLNGIPVTLEDLSGATNGNCLLNWKTTYDPFGPQFLQAKITLNDLDGNYSAKLTAYGPLTFGYLSNLVQFFESDAIFDDASAFLDAQLPAQNADYVIRLYDPATTPPTFLTAITNSTYNGIIQEDWDLTYNGGANVFMGAQIYAEFDISLSGQSSGAPAISRGAPVIQKQHKRKLNRIANPECISGNCMDGFDVVYFKTCTNNAMDSLYYHGPIWYGMQGVVDILTMPEWPWEVYYSYFNVFGYPTIFAGYPGYITLRSNSVNSVWGGLYPDLGNGTTKNLYAYGHGSKDYLGNKKPEVFIHAQEIASVLANKIVLDDEVKPTNPYRFVFLDGCRTASDKYWRKAFGIMPYSATNDAKRYKLGPQAFVGWETLKGDYLGGAYDANDVINMQDSEILAAAYTETIQQFYLDWMNGASLAQCIQNASNPNLVECPLPVPRVTRFTVNGNSYTNTYPSRIFVVGHSGLTVSGLTSADDGKFVSTIDP